MTWRDHCRPIIARVLTQNAGKPDTEIRAALKVAYPYGVRAHHPYKIWLDEIARQCKRKPERPSDRRNRVEKERAEPDPRQSLMFKEET